MNEGQRSYTDDLIAVTPTSITGARQLAEDEDPRPARERIVRDILEMYPELSDDEALMASFRGEMEGTIMIGLPRRYADAEPLIHQVNQLLAIERERYPDRFLTTR